MITLATCEQFEKVKGDSIPLPNEAREILVAAMLHDPDNYRSEREVRDAIYALAHKFHGAVKAASEAVLAEKVGEESVPTDLFKASNAYNTVRQEYKTLLRLGRNLRHPVSEFNPYHSGTLIHQGLDRLTDFGFQAFLVSPETFLQTCFTEIDQSDSSTINE